MPSPVTFNVQVGTLPAGNATKQAFAAQLAAALQISPTPGWTSFVLGASEPVSDVGPWLDTSVDPGQWKAWNSSAGRYEGVTATSETLGYIVSSTEPDPAKYKLWIKLSGSPLLPVGLYSSYSGAWKDIYRRHSFRAESTGSLSLPTNYTETEVPASLLTVERFDLSSAYNQPAGQFTAPETGVYSLLFYGQFDNNSAQSRNMQIEAWFKDVGSSANIGGSTVAVGNPPGQRWYMTVTNNLLLTAGDSVKVVVRPSDGSSANSGRAVSITRTGTIATVSLTNHFLESGDAFTLSGAGAPFDGNWSVGSVVNGNSFTFTVADSGPTTATPGTITFPNNKVTLSNTYFTGHLIERV